MEKQSGLDSVLTMTPTVMKFIEEMLEKQRKNIMDATSPEIRAIIEALLSLDKKLESEDADEGGDSILLKSLGQPRGLPTNGFNI